MNYISLHFTRMTVDIAEMASSLLLSYGFEGAETHDDGFTVYINEEEYVKNNLDNYLTEWQDVWCCLIDKQIIPQTNWNTDWEKNFSPILIGNDIYIRAPFHPEIEGVRHQIIIEPKMSFGTGHHSTTYMMLQWLLETDIKGKTVLDIGTGTGILAIMAEKLRAKAITATDNDEWCITNSLENSAMNSCHLISVSHSDTFIPNGEGYDIILANIQRSYFENHLTDVVSLLKTGGVLFTSGYLNSDISILNSRAQQNNLTLKGLKEREGWVSEMYEKS